MDFPEYKAKLSAFKRVFLTLFLVPGMKEKSTHEQLKRLRGIVIPELRRWMSDPLKEDYFPSNMTPLPAHLLTTLDDVNLSADLETLTQQAEAVKNEIMLLGKLFSSAPRIIKLESMPLTFLVTDYIRTPGGKIVYPFDYWEDCVEVYLRRYLFGNSNETIAKDYSFKTSRSGTLRAKQNLVAGMLIEIDHLKEAVLSNGFPPEILNGTKQPSIIS